MAEKKPVDDWEDVADWQEVAPLQPTKRPPDMSSLGGQAETALYKATDAIPLGRLTSNLGGAGLGATLKALLRANPDLVKGERATLTPQARAELEAMGETPPDVEGQGLVDEYRSVRDRRAERTKAGSEQNPIASGLGTGSGLVLSVAAPLPGFKAGKGATLLQRLGAATKTGAAYGALNGLTDGEADLTRGEVGQAAEDTAEGGALGGLLGFGTAALSEGLRPVLSRALTRYGTQQAKQAIQGGSDIAAATRKPLSDEAAVEALESGAVRPLSTTPAIYERLQSLVNEQGATYNQLVAELERLGVTGPKAAEVADQMLRRATELEPHTMNRALPEEYLAQGSQLAGKAGEDGYLGLTQGENLKRSLQDMARYGKVEETPLNEVRRDIASIMRQANEDAIQSAAMTPGVDRRVQTLADEFVPVKQRLGRLLEAEKFAQKGAAKAEQRSPVGLKDVIFASGAGGGNPLATAATAAGTALVRNRLPSTLASASYGLGRGLETGTTAADIAAALGTNEDVTSALIEYLRRRNNPEEMR